MLTVSFRTQALLLEWASSSRPDSRRRSWIPPSNFRAIKCRFDIILSRPAVVHPISDLNPAGAQTKALACKLQDNRGNGTVLDPDIGFFFHSRDDHTPPTPFRKPEPLCWPGRALQQCSICDKNKSPGVISWEVGDRKTASLSRSNNSFYLFISNFSTAAPVSQYDLHMIIISPIWYISYNVY